MSRLYGNLDPRNIPTYSIGDAARYLRIPEATIRSWTVGRKYPKADGEGVFLPLITIPVQKPRLLSFTNMVEVKNVESRHKTLHFQAIAPMISRNGRFSRMRSIQWI